MSAASQQDASSNSALIPYIGTEDIPGQPAIRAELNKYWPAPVIGLDNAAAKEAGSPTETVARMILDSGRHKSVAIEANARRDWIIRLIEKYGPRVIIIAEHEIWATGGPGEKRLGLEEAQAMGADTRVLIAKTPDGMAAADAPSYRYAKALQWKDRSDLIVRMSGMTPAQAESLGSCNFAEVA